MEGEVHTKFEMVSWSRALVGVRNTELTRGYLVLILICLGLIRAICWLDSVPKQSLLTLL